MIPPATLLLISEEYSNAVQNILQDVECSVVRNLWIRMERMKKNRCEIRTAHLVKFYIQATDGWADARKAMLTVN